MIAIIGASIFSIVIVLSFLIICGLQFISKSKKEKYVMTPLSAISAVCFWITAL